MIDSGEALPITRRSILMCSSSRIEPGSPGVVSSSGAVRRFEPGHSLTSHAGPVSNQVSILPQANPNRE